MMEESAVKGTVTSISSLYPVEEAQKAAKRLEEALAENAEELNRVKEFIADNTSLINLVQKLPEDLHHDIMVPFGKAAFFPGRLIHTNEFLVLLGEGYYSDRTSKQTVEILKRRGKALESQVNSLKAMMEDLRAEASFFDATASEAAEGLVEIREEYLEESSTERASTSVADISGSTKSGPSNLPEADNTNFEDEEYARIMARMDELEREELAAESEDEVDDEKSDGDGEQAESDDGDDEEQAKSDAESDGDAEQAITDFDQLSNRFPRDSNLKDAEELWSRKSLQPLKDKVKLGEQQSASRLAAPAVARDIVKSSSFEKPSVHDKVKENAGTVSSLQKTVTAPISKPGIDNSKVSVEASKLGFDVQKAFTGSIVEHAQKIQTTQEKTGTSLKPSSSQPSKPVSRFKMQRK